MIADALRDRAGPPTLAVTLIALVSGLSGSCYPTTSSPPCGAETYTPAITRADLDAVDDRDGVLSADECWALCDAHASGPSTTGDSGRSWANPSSCGIRELGEYYELSCVYVQPCGCLGRGHVSLAPPPVAANGSLGAWLARAAYAESASVRVFRLLGRELAGHGAPLELLARIREAAADEARHSRAMHRLARSRGARPPRPRFAPAQPRSLVAFAVENAVEGCVGETWGALEAYHQARFAAWPALRRAMAQIAEDETRHAELARALHDWVMPRLTPEEQALVARARARAVAALAERLATDLPVALLAQAGLPDAARARALLTGLIDAGVLPAEA